AQHFDVRPIDELARLSTPEQTPPKPGPADPAQNRAGRRVDPAHNQPSAVIVATRATIRAQPQIVDPDRPLVRQVQHERVERVALEYLAALQPLVRLKRGSSEIFHEDRLGEVVDVIPGDEM